MASLIQVRINKGDSPNLGFRLQGGKDFGTPLVIQKVPPVKPVEIKGNTTTTLREAYLLIKEHEEEINKIENIIKGGYTMQKVMEIEQEERRKADQKAVEDIKRKHLLGLITFEESILAKKKLIESNKERMAQVMVEKMELAEKLEEWRKEEQEKIKAKVNGGSPAERAGLAAGDAVIKINNIDVFNLRHKDAQDVVVRAGPSFDIAIQRGGSTWMPSVIPTGPLSNPSPYINSASPVTRTSLAATKSDNFGSVGTGHNLSAKPFGPQVNGAVNGGPKLVNKQYNTPVKLYSEESIAETLSAQTEVLSTGALGVNFKKNERNYDASNSEVLRALKEAENEPNYAEQVIRSDFYSTQSHAIGGRKPTTPNPVNEYTRSLNEQPRSVTVGSTQTQGESPKSTPPEGATICTDCERVIVGVFVRIKDKNLHVECFKCSTCGSSLKNVGYYNINNKLYCDVHAKSAALKNPPNPNLVPVTVPPGGNVPVHAISSALSSHSYPTSSPLSPKLNSAGTAYQAEDTNENVDVKSTLPLLAQSNVSESNTSNNNLFSNSTPVSFNKFLNNKSNISGPKPFSSVNAPLSPHNTLPRTAPLSPVAPIQAPSYNSPSYTPSSYSPSSGRYSTVKPAGGLFKVRVTENIVWPPPQETPEVPTACPLFYPPPSQIEQKIVKKRKEKEAEEIEEECIEVEEINAMAQYSRNLYSEYSGERRSAVESMETLTGTLGTQLLVDNIVSGGSSAVQQNIPITEQAPLSFSKVSDNISCSLSLTEDTCCQKKDKCELKRPTQYTPNTKERCTPTDNIVPLKWESPLTQAIRTTSPDKDTFASIPTKYSSSTFASALSVAPLEPFTPSSSTKEVVPLPEETVPYFPPERPVLPPEYNSSQENNSAPLPPIRKKFKAPNDKLLEDLPKPQEKLSLLSALTTAPERPYSPFTEAAPARENNPKVVGKSLVDVEKPTKPDVLPESFKMQKKDPKPPSYYPPSVLYERTEEARTEEARTEERTEESNTTKTTTVQRKTLQNPQVVQVVLDDNQNIPHSTAPLFHGFSCSFQNKGDISQFSVDVRTTPPIPTPPPTNPVIKTVETKAGYVQRETVTEETSERQQTVKKSEQIQKEKTVVKKSDTNQKSTIAKQAEEAIPIKPIPSVALRKPTQLPQYQVEISAEAESELILFEKKRQAELRLEQQKQSQAQRTVKMEEIQQPTKKLPPPQPVIKVEAEDNNWTFEPVAEDTTRSRSPRLGAPSPSNRGPAVLPYYQVNLVPQHMSALHSNVFDPKSPAVSRSPSPLPGTREHNISPALGKSGNIRATSPAPGPPENPLKSSTPLPTPESIRVDQARESLTQYLPDYKNKRDFVEQVKGMDMSEYQNPQMYTSMVQTQSFSSCQESAESFAVQKSDLLETEKSEKKVAQYGNAVMTTTVDEQLRQAHLEQLKKSQSQTVERSADGLTQIQRKRVVTEEFERSQKEVNIQIEKNVSTTRKYPFSDVNVPALETSINKGHITDPQRMQYSKKTADDIEKGICRKPQPPVAPAPATVPISASAYASTKHVFAPSSSAPVKHVSPPSTSNKPNVPSVSQPDTGAGSGKQSAGVKVAPRRGRGILNPAAIGGARIPLCGSCNSQVRGPFITALGKIWCPNHFICATPSCKRPLQDIGFVEERGQLYCEYCFEQYLAPPCAKCSGKIKGDCLKAIGKNFHPECFNCTYCGKLFGNSPFFLEDGSPYCEADWNELFTTKCFACAFPIEAGDRWVEALSNNYHSQCFNCTMCKKNLEGQSFFAKGGRPFCKNHAR